MPKNNIKQVGGRRRLMAQNTIENELSKNDFNEDGVEEGEANLFCLQT